MFYESFFYQQLHFFNWRVISLLQFKTINIHHYPYISKSKKWTELHKLIHLLLDKKLMNAFRKYVHDNLKTKCSHTNYYCCYHQIFNQTNKSPAHIFFLDKENSIRYFRKQSRDPDAINIYKIFDLYLIKCIIFVILIRDFIASFVTLTLKKSLNYDYPIIALHIENAH